MALIEIDGLPLKNGDFPWRTVSHNQMVPILFPLIETPRSQGGHVCTVWGLQRRLASRDLARPLGTAVFMTPKEPTRWSHMRPPMVTSGGVDGWFIHGLSHDLPSGYVKIAIENGHE